jgi:transposase
MGFVQGEGRTQGTLFPVTLEELIPDDHVCRVIDAFVDRLDVAGLGFERAEAAETGPPGYDPRDLLKLYLYGYLQQIRSSRRLESECRRNIELMWLLGRLAPDHKTIAKFRRLHREGKRVQLVFVRPFGRKKDARPDEYALKMALHRNGPDLSESEIAKRGRIPGRVVIRCYGHSSSEPPRGLNIETVRSKILSYVSPSAAHLQALSTCGSGQHQCRQEGQQEQSQIQFWGTN